MLYGGSSLGDTPHLNDVLHSVEGGHHILAVPKVKLSLDHITILHQGKVALEGKDGGGRRLAESPCPKPPPPFR